MGVPYAEVIGDPVEHSKSPLIHKFWLEKLGLHYDYRRTRITPGQLPAYLYAARQDPLWCGASVTIPLKRKAARLVDRTVCPAPSIGAVNTIVRRGRGQPTLVGHNTDAEGFLEPMADWPAHDPGVQLATLIGTGGAAAAVAWALRRKGVLVFVHARSREQAKTFLRDLGEDDMDFAQSLETLKADPSAIRPEPSPAAEIMINATPLGMTGYPPLEVDLAGLPPDTLIYDLVYDPIETPLLRVARERGLRTISGLDMLIGQAALAFELFFSQPAPREYDAELRQRLTS
jgi:shikimate dehydrogenase